MALEDYTDEELAYELEARKREAKNKKRRKRFLRAEALNLHMTKDIINLLQPEHSRTSCSDEGLENSGLYPEYVAPRCTRCYLLGCLSHGFDESMEIYIALRRLHSL